MMALRSIGRQASSRLLVSARRAKLPPSLPPPAAACRLDTKISFSTKSSFSPFTWFQNRQEEKTAEKQREQIEKMSNKEVWTLEDMNAGVEEGK